MASNSVKLLLVTANVGSVFEDPSRLLKAWLQEFLAKITLLKPQCLALHLQEVGGKTYEKSMEYVQEFIQKLCESEELNEYNCIRVYLDEDYNSAEHFTALGNLYFMHHSLTSVKIWNFLSHEWEIAEGKNIHTGNIEAIATKEKSKFPQHFFPECKWSRKGFMRVRWDINGTVLDLVNIHLFHDASNLAACEQFPSIYCKTRRRALVHTLERFHIDSKNGFAPFFIFGDFNFRCDTAGVIQELTKDLTSHRIQNLKNDSTKIQYRDDNGENILTVGKKEFNHSDHQIKFKESWLQKFDKELDPLRKILYEYPITFSPSYPYEEEPNMPTSYMSTRCPAWCDRIVLNLTAKDLISESEVVPENYNIIGENICMGDHKPIYLSVQLKTNQGIYRCCNCYQHANSPNHIVSASDHIISNFNKLQNNSLCFYNNSEFNINLIECNKLDLIFKCPKTTLKVQLNSNNISKSSPTDDNNLNAIDKTTRLDINNKDLSQQQQPLISINITDSDNLNICMCRILTENFKAKLKSSESDDDQIDGAICPECRNIIKRQPIEHRCTLISKRLMLANNIIVNRIDTHYLNTHLDHHHEPYTPESAESHSPCPEYETNSGGSQTESEFMTYDDTNNDNSSNSHNLSHQQLLNTNSSNIHSGKLIRTESRGIVLPGQLKSRLEHLQRTSLNNDEINSTSHINKNSMGNGCFKCCVIL